MIGLYRRRRGKAVRIFVILLIFGLLGLGIGMLWYDRGVEKPFGAQAQTQEFMVESGWGSTEIGAALKAAGLIQSDTLFKLYTWRQGISSSLQGGQYFLSPAMNIIEISDILRRGEGVTKERTITILEGWRLSQIADYLEREGVVGRQEFLGIVQKKSDWWDDYPVLASRPSTVDLEGYLFPDTYRIFRDATAQDLVKKMLGTLESKFTAELRAEVERQGKTIHDVLTLASILEREVRTTQDRKLVADLFWRRVDAGIGLQADSTVNYATGKSLPAVTAEDLEIDSPYNTYKYRGLPPGPIASPSADSIKAAIFPTPNDAWFFLTTLDDGRVIYSIDHDEHVANKARYLR